MRYMYPFSSIQTAKLSNVKVGGFEKNSAARPNFITQVQHKFEYQIFIVPPTLISGSFVPPQTTMMHSTHLKALNKDQMIKLK